MPLDFAVFGKWKATERQRKTIIGRRNQSFKDWRTAVVETLRNTTATGSCGSMKKRCAAISAKPEGSYEDIKAWDHHEV
jgi:hypothetical protein